MQYYRYSPLHKPISRFSNTFHHMAEALSAEPTFTFFRNEVQNAFFSSRETREALLQWNLDSSLRLEKFRFTGSFSANSIDEYDHILRDLFSCGAASSALNLSGSATVPVSIDSNPLGTSVMSLDFFDRVLDTIAPNGNIRGCYEDTFDGITVQDQLREMMLNEYSQNASLFSASEKNETIYRLFKLLCIGGAMCQPDDKITRYLELTKALYKELITIYRDSKTNTVQVSGRVFEVRAVSGLTLFANGDNPVNALIVVIDPLKKEIQVLKNEFRSFW